MSVSARNDGWLRDDPLDIAIAPLGSAAPQGEDFRLLADQLPALCWMADGDGRPAWYNRRWHQYCGRNADGSVPSWADIVDPEEAARVRDAWIAAIGAGETFEIALSIRGADGEFRPFLTRTSPVRDSSGKPARWVGVATEVTSLQKAEAALDASRAHYDVLTNAMPQMVWSTRPDGYHDFYNDRWYDFTGVPKGSTDGEEWNGMFHPADQDRAWERWRRSLATGDPYEIEYRLRHHSGQYRWTLGRALPVRSEDGEIIRWIGTCTDIHDAKIAAEQNEILSRELSHRIKNIFSIVAGLIALAARREPGVKTFARNLADRVSALGRAHEFARPHSENSRPRIQSTTLTGLLRELFSPYDDPANPRFTIAGEDPTVDDKGATPLALLFHELATNAAKYGALSTADGRVAITTTASPAGLTIVWEETGGPAIAAPPTQSGFGSQLVTMSVEHQLGGTMTRSWNATGLMVEVALPPGALSRD